MNPQEFAKRRGQLMRMMGTGAIAILPSAPVRKRNRDIDYSYRQDSDFFYLTGFAEPASVAVLIPGQGAGQFVVFCRERDREAERLDGSVIGLEDAVSVLGADAAYPISDIDDILPGLIEPHARVFFTMGLYPEFDHQITDWINTLRGQSDRGSHTPHEFVALDHFLHDMRLYKSRKEITALRRAARVTVGAHERAMRAVRPGLFEFELEAEIGHEFRRHNAQHAYPPIVGAGANACVLHYIRNSDVVAEHDLVLVDAGCELDYYASDVTRTFPANGRFSGEQRALYDIVLEAQLQAISRVRPGESWSAPHDAAFEVITQGLCDLNILKGSFAQLLEQQTAKRFFMHRAGHWLGIDVHDVGDYRVGDTWRMLERGMVTTIEPGIYIPADSDTDARWRGIGIRIEDVVLVSGAEPDVLTKDLVKKPSDIEAVIRG